jgi:hypothetical protein
LKRALLAAAVFAAMPAQASMLWASDFTEVENAIEDSTGTPVRWTRTGGSCAPRSNGSVTMGYFTPSANHITMCQNPRFRQSTLMNTLMHEGWHAAQDRCTKSPWFNDWEIKRHLKSSDLREIRKFYPVKQHRAEAEARAVANYYEDDPDGYIQLLEEVCS